MSWLKVSGSVRLGRWSDVFDWYHSGGEGEQAGLGFGEDPAFDQAFQFGADAFGVFGLGAETERVADILRAL